MNKKNQSWNTCPAGIVTAATQRFLTSLEGDADLVLQRMTLDPFYLGGIVAHARKMMASSITPHASAISIMGKNIFTPQDALEHFGAEYQEGQREAFEDVPFSSETLMECKESHILAAVLPLSLNVIWKGSSLSPSIHRARHDLFHLTSQNRMRQAFAWKTDKAKWFLVAKNPVDRSAGEDLNDQLDLLNDDEEMVPVRVLIYTIIGHYLKTGARLFETCEVRTSESGKVIIPGECLTVGAFTPMGLLINYCHDSHKARRISLASMKKHTY